VNYLSDSSTVPAGDHHSLVGCFSIGGRVVHMSRKQLGSAFAPDTITPHHGGYYTSGGPRQPPSDFDDPTPVPFLSIRGKFYLALSCVGEGPESGKWATYALLLLKEALKEWGVGGKTSSGYGGMHAG
jgi:CRISPR-associated protein Cmr6